MISRVERAYLAGELSFDNLSPVRAEGPSMYQRRLAVLKRLRALHPGKLIFECINHELGVISHIMPNSDRNPDAPLLAHMLDSCDPNSVIHFDPAGPTRWLVCKRDDEDAPPYDISTYTLKNEA